MICFMDDTICAKVQMPLTFLLRIILCHGIIRDLVLKEFSVSTVSKQYTMWQIVAISNSYFNFVEAS